MIEWLENLTLDLMVFYAIAFVASMALIIQVAMMVLGVGDDMDIDADAGIGDTSHPTGLHIFSLRSMTGFFGGFGWTGVLARENGLSVLAASGLGAVAGAILMLSVAYLMKVLYSLWETGTIDYQNAVASAIERISMIAAAASSIRIANRKTNPPSAPAIRLAWSGAARRSLRRFARSTVMKADSVTNPIPTA